MTLLLLITQMTLAIVFAVAGVAKLVQGGATRQTVASFGLPAALVGPLAIAVPAAELAVAAALVAPVSAVWGAAGALGLLAVFSAATAIALARGRTPDCNCFGRLSAGRAGRGTLLRNAVLGALAVFLLVAGRGAAAPNPAGTLAALTATQSVALTAGAALAAVIAGQTWLLVGLVRQGGRLLGRIEELEAAARRAPLPLLHADGSDEWEYLDDGSHTAVVGDPAPELRLPDLDGRVVDLRDLRGEATMVLFWNPDCGFCRQMLPELQAWESSRGEHDPRLLVVSSGTVADNRALGLRAPVLLDPEFAAGRAFGATGTPMAVLVAPDGNLASGPVAGGPAVLELAGRALAPTG